MIQSNFHTHTTRCKHAEGSDEDYILRALEYGLVELGFSDHCPWPIHPLDTRNIRMDITEMAGYVHAINRLKRQYANRIKIHLGIEAEFYEDRLDQLHELIQANKLEYVLLGNHFHTYESQSRFYGHYEDMANLYKDYEHDSITALESGLYDCFVHPDVFCRSLPKWTPEAHELSEKILLKAKELDIPVEYNLAGIRNRRSEMTYPYPKFWELAAQIGGPVIIGVDAHSPSDLNDPITITTAENNLRQLGIKPITFLKMRNTQK